MPSINGRERRREEAAKRFVGCEPRAPSSINLHDHLRRGCYWKITKTKLMKN
jgi:hypothetical protein